MTARIEEAAIVMLAVHLDEHGPKLTKEGDGGGLVVDQGAAAAVGPHDPADDERLSGLALEAVVAEQGERRVTGESYAADPWHASLAGLPLESRVRQLGLRVDRVEPGGQRTPWFLSRLSAWGTWVDGGAR